MVLEARVSALERKNAGYDVLLAALQASDTATALALEGVRKAIDHPKTGLIVQFDRLSDNVRGDRKLLLAVVGGALFVGQVIAPYIPLLLRAVLGIPVPT